MVIVPPGRRRVLSLAAGMLLWAALAIPGAPAPLALAEGKPSRLQLASAYLYNFLLFVHWPQERQADGPGTMTICILGDEPLAAEFAPVADKEIKETKYLLKIKNLRPPLRTAELEGCVLLFISSQISAPLGEILEQVKGLPILTVSDRPEFASEGGMLALVETQGKLRWRINQEAASQAGLRFDGQLLRNAESVVAVHRGGL